ncbi:MAG: tetratricopeptide repeat protein [Flavobacteriia bacterium]|nr:tetratricopeptide repeat protein [Flavobacteriia bacterium]
MKPFFLLWFCLLAFSTVAQQSSIQKSIDSLSIVTSSAPSAKARLGLFKEIFEEHKLSQFEIAHWAAQQGLGTVSSDNIEDRAYFTEAVGYSYQKLFVMDSALTFYLVALDLYKSLDKQSESARIMDAIARIHRKLQNHEKAIWYYSQAYAIYEELNDDEGRARILNEQGAVFENMGETRRALASYRESLNIQLERNDSVGIGYALEFIGYNYMQQDSLELSEEYLMKALEYRENMDDDFALMLNQYALGELFHTKGEYEKSDEHLNKCFELSEKLSFVDIRQYALDIAIENRKAKGEFESAILLMEKRNALHDSLAQVANQARVEELSEQFQSVERENQILVQQNEIQVQNNWIYGLSISTLVLTLIGALLYRYQRLKNERIRQEASLKLAMSTIENQNKLQALRMEISRDLHDNIGTQMTFVISSIDAIKHMLGTDVSSTIHTKLERISAFSRETIRELRDTIWAMNMDNITISDLKDRISNFISKASDSTQGVKFEFCDETKADDHIHFNSKDGMGVYRIIQEAVNNAMKHAKASRITVRLTHEAQNLLIVIEDDGSGFDNSVSLGNGISNMKKRAQELDGEFDCSTSPEGTRVTLKISIPES